MQRVKAAMQAAERQKACRDGPGGGGARVDWTDPATLTVWLAIFYPNPMTASFTGRLGENCEGFDYSVGNLTNYTRES